MKSITWMKLNALIAILHVDETHLHTIWSFSLMSMVFICKTNYIHVVNVIYIIKLYEVLPFIFIVLSISYI
jgi:hypothetical protein